MKALSAAGLRSAQKFGCKLPPATWAVRAVACVLLAVVLSGGCGRAEAPRLKSWPVKGKLLVNGQPAERAEITLHPKTPLKNAHGQEFFPHATVSADGTFSVETYEDGDGAPPGEYGITVIWPTVTRNGGEEEIGPDHLDNRYSNAKSPVASVVVEEHENTIPPIELKNVKLR